MHHPGCMPYLTHAQVLFLDCGKPFVSGGKVVDSLMPDALHPNGAGARDPTNLNPDPASLVAIALAPSLYNMSAVPQLITIGGSVQGLSSPHPPLPILILMPALT